MDLFSSVCAPREPLAQLSPGNISSFQKATQSLIKCISVSSIFALSIDHNLLGGYLWVMVIVMIGFGGVYQSRTIVRAMDR